MTVGRQLMEVPIIHQGATSAEARARALEVIRDVKLPDPERILGAYPTSSRAGSSSASSSPWRSCRAPRSSSSTSPRPRST
jgi:hypothetical protein